MQVDMPMIERLASELSPEDLVWISAYMAVSFAQEITTDMCKDGEALPSRKRFADIAIDQALVTLPDDINSHFGEIDRVDLESYNGDYQKINVVTAIRHIIKTVPALTTITLELTDEEQKLGEHS